MSWLFGSKPTAEEQAKQLKSWASKVVRKCQQEISHLEQSIKGRSDDLMERIAHGENEDALQLFAGNLAILHTQRLEVLRVQLQAEKIHFSTGVTTLKSSLTDTAVEYSGFVQNVATHISSQLQTVQSFDTAEHELREAEEELNEVLGSGTAAASGSSYQSRMPRETLQARSNALLKSLRDRVATQQMAQEVEEMDVVTNRQ